MLISLTLGVIGLTSGFIRVYLYNKIYKVYRMFTDDGFMTWNINNNKCLRCGGCVSVCPTAALELRDNIIYDEKLCTLCGICEKACPVEAIKVTNQ